MGFRTDGPVLLRDDVSAVEPQILAFDDDPSDAGYTAPIGSLILANVGSEGRAYIKTGAADTAWGHIPPASIYTSDGEIAGDRIITAAVDGSGTFRIGAMGGGFDTISLISTAAPASGGGIRLEWLGQASLVIGEGVVEIDGELAFADYGSGRDDTPADSVEGFLYLNTTELKGVPRSVLFPTGTGTSPGFNGLWDGQLYVRYSSTPPEIYAWVSSSTLWVLTN